MKKFFDQLGHFLTQWPCIKATVSVNHGYLTLRTGLNQLIEEANHRGYADTR